MKFRIQMKSPDAVGNALDEAARREVNEIEGLTDAERDLIYAERRSRLSDMCNRWFEYSEFLEVEIDTVTETCLVDET